MKFRARRVEFFGCIKKTYFFRIHLGISTDYSMQFAVISSSSLDSVMASALSTNIACMGKRWRNQESL